MATQASTVTLVASVLDRRREYDSIMSSPAQIPTVAITSLSIRDFRGIEDLTLDFCGPDGNPNGLVVVAGPNGCGKTAVLEAALLAILAVGNEVVVGSHDERAASRKRISSIMPLT